VEFWTLADAMKHCVEILDSAIDGEIQVVGRKDQPPLIILPYVKLFDPNPDKWVDFQLDISDQTYNALTSLANEKDLALKDLIVMLAYEFIANRNLEAFNRLPKDPDDAVQEI